MEEIIYCVDCGENVTTQDILNCKQQALKQNEDWTTYDHSDWCAAYKRLIDKKRVAQSWRDAYKILIDKKRVEQV